MTFKCMECDEVFSSGEDTQCPICYSREIREICFDADSGRSKIKMLKCTDCDEIFDGGGFSTGRCPTCSSTNAQLILVDAD